MENSLPDVANLSSKYANATLNWVGMSGIKIPINFNLNNHVFSTICTIQTYVNLESDLAQKSRGIHMSRIFRILTDLSSENQVDLAAIHKALANFVNSQSGLSEKGFFELNFEMPLIRDSLLSDNKGWKSYKVKIISTLEKNEITSEILVDIVYSSACPCSAALSRDLIQKAFVKEFENSENVDKNQFLTWLKQEKSLAGIPHSQRSVGQILVKPNLEVFNLIGLIDLIESTLKTATQSVVKREDEQEFARLNAENTMFCEDAARILKKGLNNDAAYKDFWIRVNHLESLHSHDATAIAVKGVLNGYDANPNLHQLIL